MSEDLGTVLLLPGVGTKPPGTSWTQTLVNFAKTSIGAGSFALPFALHQAGLVLGPVALVVISLVSLYTMTLMLECKAIVRQHLSSSTSSYSEVASAIAPGWGALAVNINVVLVSIGVGAGYLVFMGLNLRSALSSLTGVPFTAMQCYALILAVAVPLTWLRSFRRLALAAYIGTLFLVLAMGFTYASISTTGLLPPSTLPLARLDTFPMFFGIAAFLFCIHAAVIPMQTEMAEPRAMASVLRAACSLVLLLNVPFAVVGYLAFGSATQGYVFCNLPHSTAADLVRLTLVLELLCTYPLVLHPAVLILDTTTRRVSGIALRTSVVLASWALALGIPVFQSLLSLVGGLAAASLGFVLPPLFHLIVTSAVPQAAVSTRKRALHLVVLAVGVAAVAMTTTYNILDIVHNYAEIKARSDSCI